MKTLILKHDGHEAHVPYELPDSLRFDCFVPLEGVCEATVDLRSEEIDIVDVQHPDGSFMSGAGYPAAVWEQAGDVCAVFERGLESQRLMSAQYTGRVPEDDVADAKVLSTIAEIALLESDLHTAWLKLPESIRAEVEAPPNGDDPEEMRSVLALESFIYDVLLPRAQDQATKAAKRRQSEWAQEYRQSTVEFRSARMTDLTIDIAKERA